MPTRALTLPLRTVLRLDGLVCLAMGGALVALADSLAGPTGLTPTFLTLAGALLLPVGLFILAVAWPAEPPRAGVALVVAGNALWVVASIGVVVTAVVNPTPLGTMLILGQAAAVAVIAVLEAAPLATPRAARA